MENFKFFFYGRGVENIWEPTVRRNASENKQVLRLLFADWGRLVLAFLKKLFLKIFAKLKKTSYFKKLGLNLIVRQQN